MGSVFIIFSVFRSMIVRLLGEAPHALVFTKADKGYVNNKSSRDLTVVNGNISNIVKTIPLPAFFFQLALSPDGKSTE